MDEAAIAERLTLFGLTRQEATLYLCLLKNDAMTGYEVSKQTGISRSNVYNSLAGLVENGAAYMMEGASSRYVAVEVEEFCENFIKHVKEEKNFLKKHIAKPTEATDGYITIVGARHITDKFGHMLESATKRIYLAAPGAFLEKNVSFVLNLLKREIHVVLLAEYCPKELVRDQIVFYKTLETKEQGTDNQLRMIIDSKYVLTGDLPESEEATCLFCGQKNFVSVFKEAMRNEIKLINLTQEG